MVYLRHRALHFEVTAHNRSLKKDMKKKKNFVRDRKIQIARSKNENLKS
jgi:hypothetical protein